MERPSRGWELTRPDGTSVTLGVIEHPARKSLMLMVEEGSVIHALAYFRSDEDGQKTIDIITEMVKARYGGTE